MTTDPGQTAYDPICQCGTPMHRLSEHPGNDAPADEIARIHGHRVGDEDAWIESQAALNERDSARRQVDALKLDRAELARHNQELTNALAAAERRAKEAEKEVERLRNREQEWDGYEKMHERLSAKLTEARAGMDALSHANKNLQQVTDLMEQEAIAWERRATQATVELDRLKSEVIVLELQVGTYETVNKMQVDHITKQRAVIDAARNITGGYKYPSVMSPPLRSLSEAVAVLDRASPPPPASTDGEARVRMAEVESSDPT